MIVIAKPAILPVADSSTITAVREVTAQYVFDNS